jgi:hypothetical protein
MHQYDEFKDYYCLYDRNQSGVYLWRIFKKRRPAGQPIKSIQDVLDIIRRIM